ncbi:MULTISPECIES: hypothetical protein [unclassified Luteimonas]
MVRSTFAVLLGLLASLAAISLLGFVGLSLFVPEATVPGTEEELAQAIASQSAAELLWKLASWLAAAFAGAWIAARIARANPLAAAMAVGLLLLAGLAFETTSLPYPAWVTVAGVLLPLPVAWFAARLARPRQRTPSP